MDVDLTPEQIDLVRHALATGRIAEPSQAVREAMALWVERERRRIELLASLDAAELSVSVGEGVEIAPESMGALSREVMARCRVRIAAEQRANG
jgi:Arc/MetJ-type ribon-helix-helix transcriptional regulator